jgi:uncharacterized protein (TIGR03905 family)
MKKHRYKTRGTCSRRIDIELDGQVVRKVRFTGGCTGNTQGVSRLAKGRTAQELIELLEGIQCQNGTSCPDQLAKALRQTLL